jgi:MinD superfamily P-loop ATPase
MSDPLHRAEWPGAGARLREAAASLIELFVERSAEDPMRPSIESRQVRLAKGRRVACVSLIAGCGTTTLAALLAQRSGGAGARVRLLDLDLASPTVALIAGQQRPTVTDVLVDPSLRPGRWGSIDVYYGGGPEIGPAAAPALGELVRRCAAESAVVVDAGALSTPPCEQLLRACDTVLYITTPRAAHVFGALRGIALLRALAIDAHLVVTQSDPHTAGSIARELGVPLAAAIPEDPFLAKDEFRIRAETARAIDLLCGALVA